MPDKPMRIKDYEVSASSDRQETYLKLNAETGEGARFVMEAAIANLLAESLREVSIFAANQKLGACAVERHASAGQGAES